MRPELAPQGVNGPRVPPRVSLGRPSKLPAKVAAVLVAPEVSWGPAGPRVHAVFVPAEARSHTAHRPEILGSPQLPLPGLLHYLPLPHMHLHLVRLLLLLLLLRLLVLLLLRLLLL